MIVKYYPNKINGKNHIFKKEEDVTALCGMSGFNSSWGNDPEEIKLRRTCRNCKPLHDGDHPFTGVRKQYTLSEIFK